MERLSAEDPTGLGPYRLHARLGSGGTARVYLGFSPAGRAVAVKVLRAGRAVDPTFRARFWREVTAVRQISGAYTAPVLDAGLDGDRHWLATAFVPGPSLLELVGAQGPLPARAVWRLAGGLAEALGAVHACGVVHRDLKPANVLLAVDGPRVIDFGLSRMLDSQTLTPGELVCGTPGFMSPEQAEGEPVGPASDLFSLGCVLAFARTGAEPFGTGRPTAVMYRIVHGQAYLGGLQAPLRDLVVACLDRDPGQRPTPGEVMAAAAASSLAGGSGAAASFWPEPVATLIESHRARVAHGMVSHLPAADPGHPPAGAGRDLALAHGDRRDLALAHGGKRDLTLARRAPMSREPSLGADPDAGAGPAPGLSRILRRGTDAEREQALDRRRVLTRRQAMSLLIPVTAAAAGLAWVVSHNPGPGTPASPARPGAGDAGGGQGQVAAGSGAPGSGETPTPGRTPTGRTPTGGTPTAPPSRVQPAASASNSPPVPPGQLQRESRSRGNPNPPGQVKMP